MKLWKIKRLAVNENGTRFRLEGASGLLTFREVFDLWRSSDDFVVFYVSALTDLGYEGLFWEHPPLKEQDLDRDYEVIVLRTRMFGNRTPDESSFAEHFSGKELVRTVDNLGRNARLVIPSKQGPAAHFVHLATFLVNAKKEQAKALFEQIGGAMELELKAGKVIWLSTAGMGVSWLHVRLDTRPKYYKTQAYKNPDYWKETT